MNVVALTRTGYADSLFEKVAGVVCKIFSPCLSGIMNYSIHINISRTSYSAVGCS